MTYLLKAKKEDLFTLADDLGGTIFPEMKKCDLIEIITKSQKQPEENKKIMLEVIVEEREKVEEKEREKERKEKEREKEREEREKERDEKEKEREEREKEREFELKRLEIEATIRSVPQNSILVNSNGSEPNLKKILMPFDAENGDISLFLLRFEEEAENSKLNQQRWVSHLMHLLPTKTADFVTRESCGDKNYNSIKKLLLQKYKLTPEQFRQKLIQNQRHPECSWKEFGRELQNYLNEWINGLNVMTYDELKDLIVTDQMKRRVNEEVRDHYVDRWAEITSVKVLAELLDNYEINRGYKKLASRNNQVNRKFDYSRKNNSPKEKRSPIKKTNNRQEHQDQQQKSNEEWFEKRRSAQCYECGSSNHFKAQCPNLKKISPVNRLQNIQEKEEFQLFTSVAKINGYEMPLLRDTGASIDLICRKYVEPKMYTGETVWIKQPLDEEPICLPVVQVEIKGHFGNITTKAAVIPSDLDAGHYLMGNRTATLLPYDILPCSVNRVQIKIQEKLQENNSGQKLGLTQVKDCETMILPAEQINAIEELAPDNIEDDAEEIDLPLPQFDNEITELIKIDHEKLAKAQRESVELKPLFEKAQNSIDNNPEIKEYFGIENNVLVKFQKSRHNQWKKLIIVPESYRTQIKKLCHEGTSGHLGVKKSKYRMTRYYFWPNCHRDIELYVRTCDLCQKAGKGNEKKKAPLTQVPIISEVFSKINVDACGPLPSTQHGNRYMITAICMSSKYPEAIPVTDISSVCVIDALLSIFSRMGFPKEIQCDQGTSFVSELTTTFFEKLGITIRHSSVNHPQSNPVERFHRTLKRILRTVCHKSGSDWDVQLPLILFALRTAVHESTGFTPAELVHGKNLRSPETLLYEKWIQPDGRETPVTEYVFNLINRLRRYTELAVENMEKAQIKNKLWYDRNAVKREFKEGDLVLILATRKANKFSSQWIGPGTIMKKLSDTNYVVQLHNRTQLYHINMLKPYYKRPEVINFLPIFEDDSTKISEDEVEFPKIESNPNVYDYSEVVKSSKLEERLNCEQIGQLKFLLNRFAKCFSNQPGLTKLVEHDIELISDKVIRTRAYRVSPRQNQLLRTEIQKMLHLKIIEIGESDYTSPMILVEAPGKDPRPCIDYRRLNEITKTQFYPLPNIDERVETVSAAKFITVLDFSKGYWQIPLSKRAQYYAAFVTSFGTYRPLRMPFGLKNAPYFFSKLMAELLRNCENFAVPYLDDIAIYSNDWETHIHHIKIVLQRISDASLTIKPSKCKFAQDHVLYLGHIVGQGYHKPAELKIQTVIDYPPPVTKTQIRAFLGLAGYYRKYIPMFSPIAAPLTDALKGRVRKGNIQWNAECEDAFEKLKKALISKPILYAPDYNKEFILQTDASDKGMGVVLSQQRENGEEHPIVYLSKKFNDTERKYSTTEKECASIVFAIKRLNHYLDGQKFKIQTDHNPLIWLKTHASSNPRLMRWALALQPYDFKMEHRSGSKHKNADSLSRLP